MTLSNKLITQTSQISSYKFKTFWKGYVVIAASYWFSLDAPLSQQWRAYGWVRCYNFKFDFLITWGQYLEDRVECCTHGLLQSWLRSHLGSTSNGSSHNHTLKCDSSAIQELLSTIKFDDTAVFKTKQHKKLMVFNLNAALTKKKEKKCRVVFLIDFYRTFSTEYYQLLVIGPSCKVPGLWLYWWEYIHTFQSTADYHPQRI